MTDVARGFFFFNKRNIKSEEKSMLSTEKQDESGVDGVGLLLRLPGKHSLISGIRIIFSIEKKHIENN